MARWIAWVGAATVLTAGAATADAASCSVSLMSGLNFGEYSPHSNSLAMGTIVIRCTSVGPNTVTVYLLQGSAGTFWPRSMAATMGSARMQYNLYLDAPRTMVWGDGTMGTSYWTVGLPAVNTPVSQTVYGIAWAHQDSLTIGSYFDSVTVEVNF